MKTHQSICCLPIKRLKELFPRDESILANEGQMMGSMFNGPKSVIGEARETNKSGLGRLSVSILTWDEWIGKGGAKNSLHVGHNRRPWYRRTLNYHQRQRSLTHLSNFHPKHAKLEPCACLLAYDVFLGRKLNTKVIIVGTQSVITYKCLIHVIFWQGKMFSCLSFTHRLIWFENIFRWAKILQYPQALDSCDLPLCRSTQAERPSIYFMILTVF